MRCATSCRTCWRPSRSSRRPRPGTTRSPGRALRRRAIGGRQISASLVRLEPRTTCATPSSRARAASRSRSRAPRACSTPETTRSRASSSSRAPVTARCPSPASTARSTCRVWWSPGPTRSRGRRSPHPRRTPPAPAAEPVQGAASAPQGASDIVAAIESLADLHRRGILTDEEFAAKKAELLGRL
ncbi:SHOCT domain-containing protein [Gordonia paraffinivorans]|uniref:SHOCT domain-containing protein n=1 Tax=Gordonia paraffinivorans TaxID=175628 RepID=UPI003555DF3F